LLPLQITLKGIGNWDELYLEGLRIEQGFGAVLRFIIATFAR